MVIQRKQSSFLLITAILMGVYAFMPSLIDANGNVILGGICLHGVNAIPFILNCLVALLAFVTIFKFKSLGFQKTLSVVCILLIIASIATMCGIAFLQKDCDLLGSLTYFNVMPLLAIIFLLLAHKGISHDKKLLSDSGRIR